MSDAKIELPKAQLRRLIRARLLVADTAAGGDGTRDFQVNKDALLAFSEAGKLFIHYLTATANELAKEAKRQTISADDVLVALNDLDFGQFIEPLRAALDEFKAEQRGKSKRRSEAAKKRRSSMDASAAAEAVATSVDEQVQESEKRQKTGQEGSEWAQATGKGSAVTEAGDEATRDGAAAGGWNGES